MYFVPHNCVRELKLSLLFHDGISEQYSTDTFKLDSNRDGVDDVEG